MFWTDHFYQFYIPLYKMQRELEIIGKIAYHGTDKNVRNMSHISLEVLKKQVHSHNHVIFILQTELRQRNFR